MTGGVEADLLAGGLDRLGPAVEPLDVYRPRPGAVGSVPQGARVCGPRGQVMMITRSAP